MTFFGRALIGVRGSCCATWEDGDFGGTAVWMAQNLGNLPYQEHLLEDIARRIAKMTEGKILHVRIPTK